MALLLTCTSRLDSDAYVGCCAILPSDTYDPYYIVVRLYDAES